MRITYATLVCACMCAMLAASVAPSSGPAGRHSQGISPVSTPTYSLSDWWKYVNKDSLDNPDRPAYFNETEIVTILSLDYSLSVNGSTYSTWSFLHKTNGTHFSKYYTYPELKYHYTINATRYVVKSNYSLAYEQSEAVRRLSDNQTEIERVQTYYSSPTKIYKFPMLPGDSWGAPVTVRSKSEKILFDQSGRVSNNTKWTLSIKNTTYTAIGEGNIGTYSCMVISNNITPDIVHYSPAAGRHVMKYISVDFSYYFWVQSSRLVAGNHNGNSLPAVPDPDSIYEPWVSLIPTAAAAAVALLAAARRRTD